MLDLTPHAVRLEVPKDGSVPRVMAWQSRRRLAPAREHSHAPGESDAVVTESGLAMPSQVDDTSSKPLTGDGEPGAVGEEVCAVDRVEFAERAGNRYKIWLKWQGYDELTWRWAHELRKENSADSEVIKKMETEPSAMHETSAGTAPQVQQQLGSTKHAKLY